MRSIIIYSFRIITILLATGCVVRESVSNGLGVYDDIMPRSRYYYYLPEGTRLEHKELAFLALNYWNHSLGQPVLHVTSDQKLANVKIIFSSVAALPVHPGHTKLLGCLRGYRALSDCEVQVTVPDRLDAVSDLATLSYLFAQGPLDERLYSLRQYQDPADYLRDKLVLMTLVHEIGHTLGLSHTSDPSCVMATAPRGGLHFCDAELAAIRQRAQWAAH